MREACRFVAAVAVIEDITIASFDCCSPTTFPNYQPTLTTIDSSPSAFNSLILISASHFPTHPCFN